MLNLIDAVTWECRPPREYLPIRIDQRMRSTHVIKVPSEQFILRGAPDHIRSGSGPEFVVKGVRE